MRRQLFVWHCLRRQWPAAVSPAPGGAELKCRYVGTGGAARVVSARNAQVVAIAVGTLTRQ